MINSGHQIRFDKVESVGEQFINGEGREGGTARSKPRALKIKHAQNRWTDRTRSICQSGGMYISAN